MKKIEKKICDNTINQIEKKSKRKTLRKLFHYDNQKYKTKEIDWGEDVGKEIIG